MPPRSLRGRGKSSFATVGWIAMSRKRAPFHAGYHCLRGFRALEGLDQIHFPPVGASKRRFAVGTLVDDIIPRAVRIETVRATLGLVEQALPVVVTHIHVRQGDVAPTVREENSQVANPFLISVKGTWRGGL